MVSQQGSRAVIQESPQSHQESLLRGEYDAWAQALRRRNLEGVVTWLLEVGRPWALLAAQALHVGGPFLGSDARYLAQLLESESETARFLEGLNTHKTAPLAAGGVRRD